MTTILALLSAALLLLFLHPYVTYPLSLLLFRDRPIRKGTGPRPASLALLFAAYNEERALPAKLANLKEIKALHPAIDIVAYSDMSSDRTLDMLSARPELVRVVPSTERTGKATGMRRMVESSYADICWNPLRSTGCSTISATRRWAASPERCVTSTTATA